MNGNLDLERGIRAAMRDAAPPAPPARLLANVRTGVGSERQRPRWLSLALTRPMRRGHEAAAGGTWIRAAALGLAAAAAVSLAAGAALVGARLLLPATVQTTGPNGLIAFDAGFDIVVADQTGAGRRSLTQDANADTDPTWSPDGRRLAFWSRLGRSGPMSLAVIDADGSGRREIRGTDTMTFTGGTGGHANIAWDPTGANRVLVVASVDGVGTPVLIDLATGASSILDAGGLDVFTAIWAPDGQSIAFVGDGAGGRSMWTIRPDGSEARQIRPATTSDAAYTSISWSPDSRRLAYTRIGDGGTHDVDMLDLSTGVETHVATGGEYFWPRFSPDGTSIVFTQGVTPMIWIVHSDGSDARVVAPGLASEDVNWSPDGRDIYAFGPDLASLDIVPVDGGQIVQIDSLGSVGAPSWQRVP